jgi:orotidine-5'-phosphate decarboxylase
MGRRFHGSTWLTPWEQREAIQLLLRYGLIKFSNKRDLPLKSGGKTDIYINLRDARNFPAAIEYIADLYANALRRLRLARFVEVPDAVSCFAGPIAIKTGLPYLTIREKAKEGRVAKADMIGSPNFGEYVGIFDDVITDGESKVAPYLKCKKAGLDPDLIVLVDRQQGWRKKFEERGINMDVWPGMTLHDVRRFLIENGIMDRCDKALEDENPLIVAYDAKDWDAILPMLDQLRTTGCISKVNDMMFNYGIKNLIPDLQVYGRVMVDLKGHDIPNTIANIMKHVVPHRPWAVTVHASGGEKMVNAAVRALEGTGTKVLAVTVLTSIDEKTGEEIYSRLPFEQVKVAAEIAHRAGAHGFVSSADTKEVSYLKEKYPDEIRVTPGVRSPGADAGDQKRVTTPKEAMENGSDYLVMGRQILGASDPVAEVKRLLNEELKRAA